jgi:multidrug efflux pump subunit AcrB
MRLHEVIAGRPVGASLVAIGIVLLGALAYGQLPIALLPSADAPTIMVAASLPGASPKTIAATVAAPLERQLGRIAGVTELTSYSIYGRTAITVQFELGRNTDHAANDVQAAINAAAAELPKDLPEPPTFAKHNPTTVPLLHLALTSDTLPLGRVSDYAETIVAQKLAAVEGVAAVDVDAAEKPAVRMRIDPAALSSLGLGLEDIRTAVAAATANVPKGSLGGTGRTEIIAERDKPHDAAGYRSLVIASRNGAPVHLGEVATVLDDKVQPHAGGWLNGHRAVFVTVTRQAGANLVETTERIRALLRQLQHSLPAGIKVAVLSDRSVAVRSAIAHAQLNWAVTVTLVAAAAVLFLRRGRAGLVAIFAALVAVAGGLIALALLHYSLDVISLTALTVAAGFVIAEPLVMIDSIRGHSELGQPALEATLRGAREVGRAILAMAAASVAVLLPLSFAPGIAGLVTEEIAVGLGAAVVLSTSLSLTVVPALCGRLLVRGPAVPPLPPDPRRGPGRLLECYAVSLRWALRHQRSVLALILLTYGATAALYILMPTGFVPPQDSGVVWGSTEGAADASSAERSRRAGEAARIIMADPAVAEVAYSVSDWDDWLSVNLKPAEQRNATAEGVVARLDARLQRLPGVKTYLQPVQDFWLGGQQGHAQYQYSLLGEDVDELNRWVPIVRDRLLRLPELKDVGSYRADQGLEARLHLDRDRAAQLGISAQDIAETLYSAFGQRQVAMIYGAVGQVPVVLEADSERLDPAVLRDLSIKSAGGEQVTLGSVAHTDFTIAPIAIARQGQLPYVTLTFNLSKGTSLSQAIAAIRAAEAELRLPSTIWGRFDSNAKEFEVSSRARPVLILAAAVVVYLVLGMLYESYAQPLTVLATLPFAGVGAGLALFVCGLELSLMAFGGIVLLVGICSKASIMMVDAALQGERECGMPAQEAILAACLSRFRPILAITATAALGTVPLIFAIGPGSELQRPLGISVAGGALGAQLATIYMTPVIYIQLARLRRGRAAKLT